MTETSLLWAATAAALLVLWAVPASAQELPACNDPEVSRVAAEAVTEAHQRSNFAGLGGENKIVQVLKDLRAPASDAERESLAGGIAFLAERAGYGAENIRACYSSDWAFQRRAAVFIMRAPDDPSAWGLFMYNVALDVPVATGWLLAPEEPAPNP
ncbi:MAG: hypothetical protein O2905_05320 [Proteobacteria bacterium]|nr:hypothetical protein [Pseudomonadota bacterium]MDA1132626.1 hypothetical protein [Pseudomonadota bacterium]